MAEYASNQILLVVRIYTFEVSYAYKQKRMPPDMKILQL